MMPLIILLATFLAAIFATKLFRGQYRWMLAGRVALSVMLLFTAIGHFAFTEGMAKMLPAFVPNRILWVYLTGVLEIAAAIGLLIPKLRMLTGWLLIVFFIGTLPANVYAAAHHINYQTGADDGHGLAYLWFRIPLQVLFIVWAYLFAVRK